MQTAWMWTWTLMGQWMEAHLRVLTVGEAYVGDVLLLPMQGIAYSVQPRPGTPRDGGDP